MNTLSVRECLRFGWNTFKKRSWFFIGALLAYAVAWLAVTQILAVMTPGADGSWSAPGQESISLILSFFVNTLFGMGMTMFMLKAHDAVETVALKDFWAPANFGSYAVASILTGFLVLVGTILLIVPGIILSLMFFATLYLVLDKGRGPIEAIKESARITKGHKWQLFLLVLASAGVCLLGLLALVVGLLVAVPVTALAAVHAYRTLEHKASEVTPAPAPFSA